MGSLPLLPAWSETVICQKPQCCFFTFGVNDLPSTPIICLDYSNDLQCPRVTSITKLALLSPSDTSCRHPWDQGITRSPKRKAVPPGLSKTGPSYSRAENNLLENHSLLFSQLTLPDLAAPGQLLSYLWFVFFFLHCGSCYFFAFSRSLSGHHCAAGQPGSRGMLE